MNWMKIALGAVAFFISSFVIQGILGYILGGEYFMSIPIMRQTPLASLSFTSTILSGVGFAILYPLTNLGGSPMVRGLKFGVLIGSIMIPFVAFDIPGRFMIPSEGQWIVLQAILGMIHFSFAGILIGFIHKNMPTVGASNSQGQ